MRLYFEQNGNEAGGRPVELITEDEGTAPDVALQKARKLVEQDEVAIVAGIVSSGVLAGLRDYFDENRKLLIVANAGSNALSRAARSRYIWRTSFTNWMAPYTMGVWAAANAGRRAAISVPDYAAGENNVAGFSHSFTAGGGEVVLVQRTPFPNMGDPAPFVAELADSGADLVYAFYSGSAAVTFVQAYDGFGLKAGLPLLAAGFMTEEDVLPALGETARGIRSALHWSYFLDSPENEAFKAAYREANGEDANVFAVQGYDTARVIAEALDAVEGDGQDVEGMVERLEGLTFASPRGPFTLDGHSQSPRHNMYLREVREVEGELRNAVLESLGEIVDPGDDSRG
jgi:branched-chain amino acid transport system substrate-binding protein